jgi:hypothetical protein
MDRYDLWVDFASMAGDGTLWTRSSHLRPGLRVSPGDVVIVGSEDAMPARARVISVDSDGALVVKMIGDEASVARSAGP